MVLLDIWGNIVYILSKDFDFGINILIGLYCEFNLCDVYFKVLGVNVVDFIWIIDFKLY